MAIETITLLRYRDRWGNLWNDEQDAMLSDLQQSDPRKQPATGWVGYVIGGVIGYAVAHVIYFSGWSP